MSGRGLDAETYLAASRLLHAKGMNPREWTNLMVVAEALARGFDLSVDSRRARIQIEVDGKRHWWKSGLTSLNSGLIMRITKNKDVASRLLRAQGNPVVENASFQKGEAERAWGWAQSLGSLVIKPSDGTWGTGVHVGVTTWPEFQEAFNDVTAQHRTVIVERQASGKEFRFVVVAGRVVAVTAMRPANVVGDGRTTIARLVKAKNLERARSPIHRDLVLGGNELETLEHQGLTPTSVPAAGAVVYLRRTTNLQTMGEAVDATEAVSPGHKKAIERAAAGLPRGRLLGFDVLIDDAEREPVQILEVNSGPMISIQHLPMAGEPRDVAGAVLNAMFPTHARPARESAELQVPTAKILEVFRPSWPKLRRVAGRVKRALK